MKRFVFLRFFFIFVFYTFHILKILQFDSFFQAEFFSRTNVGSSGIAEEKDDDEYYSDDDIEFVLKKRPDKEVCYNIF